MNHQKSKVAFPEDDLREMAEPLSKTDFGKIYKEADLQKKLDFLNQLLQKDADLQSQFVAFVSSPFKNLDTIAGIDIEKIKNEVFKKLSSIDFDSAVENYHGSYDGYYDDEGSYDAAYSLIEDVFEKYLEKAIEFLKKGNLLDAFRVLLGVYEGAQGLPEPNDEYCLFEDGVNEKVSELFSHALKDFAPDIESVVKANETILLVIDLFFERYSKYELDDSKKDISINYDMKLFENVLNSLITGSETAGYLYKKIQEHDLENLSTAFILLKIAELTANNSLWIETAETFAGFEQAIARQLLEKYRQIANIENFNHVAMLAFNKWPGEFDLYLTQYLNKESQKDLYIKALRHYTKEKRDIASYNELRNLIPESELYQFINDISQGYNVEFYVQILEIEKRYEDILQFVRKNKDSYSFENIVKPIVTIYPDECFEIIVEKCSKALVAYNRNRHTYQHIARWLKTIKGVDAKQTEIRAYVQSLYNLKPVLPALKDELKIAGLI